MCGISGWYLKPGHSLDKTHLVAMSDSLAHRGPDDSGIFWDEKKGIGLAHRRLSIIDLSSAGHQPMISEDGKTVLVYNGELYNFQELKAELETLGHQFVSRTDSEVVLRSYMQWGKSCLDRFCGMFALAIWSEHEKTLFLARDPMGIKPLYYTTLPQGFLFASEMKAFLALPNFVPQINRHSLQQFLEFGYVFYDDHTMLENVLKLPPGHSLSVIDGNLGKAVPFFFPPSPFCSDDSKPSARTPDSLADTLYKTLSEVVGEHLIADVPVGLLLSGGLDSGILASIASRHTKVTTVSMGFAESSVDEREFAKLAAGFIGSEHHEVLIHPQEVFHDLEEAIWCFDDLFGDWGTLTTRILYKRCHDMGIKVVLVGEGCDELFGGYSSLTQFSDFHGPIWWQLFRIYRWYAGRRYGKLFPEFYSIWREYLKKGNGDHFYAKRWFESRTQLPNNYVMKVDKASMSVSVEARTPYLDRRIAEFAYQLPKEYLLSAETNKVILRNLSERHKLLPPEIAKREKYGASIAASWMDESEQMRQYARSVILAKSSWVDELGLRKAMIDFFDGRRKGYRFPRAISIFSNLAWRLLLLNLWSCKYLTSWKEGVRG
jgi:asparagine synthase (glutamine-hydrolysing)